jgi:hypothetical protein
MILLLRAGSNGAAWTRAFLLGCDRAGLCGRANAFSAGSPCIDSAILRDDHRRGSDRCLPPLLFGNETVGQPEMIGMMAQSIEGAPP